MAAGLGTRMRSATPKHLHPLLGRRIVDWVIAAARDAGAERIVIVASPEHARALRGLEVAVQERPLGTGDAVRSARAALEGFAGDVLVLNGDVPALTAETLRALVATHRGAGAAGTVLSFGPADARAYGRIVRDGGGRLARIVEAGDATAEELAVREVNSGIYVFRADRLWPALERLEPHNAQGELYVTDTLGLLVGDGEPFAVHVAPDPFEVEGINTRVELAAVAAALRDRINEAHMLAGVTIVDPASTWIDADVEIEPDVTIHPVHRHPRTGADRERRRGRPVRLRSPRDRGSARTRRSARSSRSRTRSSGPARRCRTSPTSATPRSARARTSAPAPSPPTSSTSRACRRRGRRSAGTSGPASTMCSMRRSRSETTAGLRRVR